MSTQATPLVDGTNPMSAYEEQVWDTLKPWRCRSRPPRRRPRPAAEHWQHRDSRRGLPNWASNALDRTGEIAGGAVRRVKDDVPDAVTEPLRRAGDAVTEKAMRP
ncbi:hypothetical protein [[Kitasatospora] papulosa]|uniref:hypothetical protein n=1 Tax=[Kitasatospora] papulosa TaxID=1464011 RepID=UPI0037F1A3E1